MVWWGSETRHERTIAAIELYQKLNPNIDIDYDFYGWHEYWVVLDAQAAKGSLPDIIQHSYAFIEEYANNGWIMSLDNYVSSGAIDTTHIAEAALTTGIVEGELVGIALGVNAEVFALDTDAFADAGIELPPADWTWTHFEEIATQISERLGLYGIGELNSEEMWKAFIVGCCNTWVYADDGRSLGYNDDQPLIDFFHMLLRLQATGGIQPFADWVARGNQGMVEEKLIVTDEAAMAYLASNQLVAMWNASGDDRDFVLYQIPRPEGGQAQSFIRPSMYFSVAAHTKYPDEAVAFIDWFVNSPEANTILQAERGVPISAQARQALLPYLGPAEAQVFSVLDAIEQDSKAFFRLDPVAHRELVYEVYVPTLVEPIMYGLQSPEEATAKFREEANRLLASQ